MNIYFVLSELLHDRHDPAGDECLFALVVARTHSQARYLTWQSSKKWRSYYLEDAPMFTVRKLNEAPLSAAEEPHIVTTHPSYAHWWMVTDGMEIKPPVRAGGPA